ncbi:hypothetical protein B0T22DRAFT_491389 [Podospora appendiculata]|uniref:Uncharacterized protein n=1 Tax=Podospora appendiculata TaxID=314037 RepID=A0AAE0XCI2_9PEZI|nr:hypothetical protein B0T22DRAFT_491389 [Podospora appendiculata]
MTGRKRKVPRASLGDIPDGLVVTDGTAPESSPVAKRSKRSKRSTSHCSPKQRAGEENQDSTEITSAEDETPLSSSVSEFPQRFPSSALDPVLFNNMAIQDPDNNILDPDSSSDDVHVASAANGALQISSSDLSPPPPSSELMEEAAQDGEARSKRKTAKKPKGTTKQLKKLNKNLENHAETVKKELELLKKNVTALELRQQRDEIRAAFRHEILFSTLKKILHDINQSELRDKTRAGIAADETAGDSPKPGKKTKSGKQARKTMDQLLKGYTEDMNKAFTVDEVRKLGQLCIQYAEDLFKICI